MTILYYIALYFIFAVPLGSALGRFMHHRFSAFESTGGVWSGAQPLSTNGDGLRAVIGTDARIAVPERGRPFKLQ
ncbi:hypothetical protein SAMN05519103_03950 [Rhizobiales bacterium GAS113]|nr:hypothetical protein SAMN05519103_03950 [Rhizobiales bacterium GAS113]